jgi:two-component system, chemotaxis family, chemotaxis protein CheY
VEDSISVRLAGLRAVIIDNNTSMRGLLRSLLAASGLTQTFEAADSREGIEQIREIKPELVICDLSMRPMDGITFTRHLRWDEDSPNPYQPIIMIVGQDQRHRLSEVRDCGVSAIVVKPVTVQNLLSHIVEIVERPKPFVRIGTYFGPDRRSRSRESDFSGPRRREADIFGKR